jgi:DNA relaxase NicK
MIEYFIDYFRITVHLSKRDCMDLYHHYFHIALGDLVELEHGAKGFKGVLQSLHGFQLKHSPGKDLQYCTFEFSGQVCRMIPPEFFIAFYRHLVWEEIKFNVTRIDLALDHVPFTPHHFDEAIKEDQKYPERKIIRSLSRRDSYRWESSPFKEKEDGRGFAQNTAYFGSRFSERFLRVYDKRGPTRLEAEFKGERASLVTDDLLTKEEKNWYPIMIGHLLDFIDINKPWWREFVGKHERRYARIQSAKEESLDQKRGWLHHQVAPTLAAVVECEGYEELYSLLEEGKKRMRDSHQNLLSLHGK